MKKLLFFISALAGLFFAASCEREEMAPASENAVVTYSVEVPEIATRAIGDDVSNINDLVYAVYCTEADNLEDAQNNGGLQLLYQKNYTSNPFVGGKATISFELVNDKNYLILFWAQNEDKWVGTPFDLTAPIVCNSTLTANDENLAAFSGVDFLKSDNLAVKRNLTLKRAVAQINIATKLPNPNKYTMTLDESSVVVKNAGARFNVVKQVAEGNSKITFQAEDVPAGTLSVSNKEYKYAAMNYIFANGNVEVTYNISYETDKGITGTVSNTVPGVPVAQNYRTNIIGSLLTSQADYTVELGPFDENGNSGNIEVLTEGIVKNQYGDYEISSPNGMAFAMNNLWAQYGGTYYVVKSVDMLPYFQNGNLTIPSIPAGKTLNVHTAIPVVTRSTDASNVITISGLPYLIQTIDDEAKVSLQGVTMVGADDTKLVNEIEDGATVVVSDCTVNDETEVEDIIANEGVDNVVDASSVEDLATLQTVLASGVKNVTLTKSLSLTGDVTLDLNGKQIYYEDPSTASNYAIATTAFKTCNLTIKNSANTPASITMRALNNRGWSGYSSVVSTQPGGTLTVEGNVTIEHLGGTDMAYGIDNLTNGKGTSAVTVIDGATIKSTYRAIRQFLNGIEATNSLTVKDGSKVEGANKSIWVQDPSKNANTGSITVEAGAELYGNVYLSVTEGSTEWPVEVSIASSALVDGSQVLTSNIPSQFVVVEQNGVYTVAPTYAVEGNTYTVNCVTGLTWVAEQVNAGDNFNGKTIVLGTSLDLNNEEWTVIGTEEHPFSGTFDGNNNTIKNLSIIEEEAKEGKAFIGFFGYAKNATIKNVVFENVNLNIACLDIDHSQGHIGAVAGSLEGTSTIENVTVKGDIKVESTVTANGASRVAVVAGGNSYGNVTMKNVHVVANEGSYLKANNNVGALAGQLQGKSVFENCSSNIDVTGTKFFAGGIIGLAAGDQMFKDCHTTGDVTITAGREGRANDHYRVGGIAGGWADGKTKVCTLTNCTYEGTISGTNADGSVANPLDYAGYVGRGYTLTNCAGSKVIIDGVEYVQLSDKNFGVYSVNGIYEVSTAADLQWLATEVNNGGNYFEGITVKLTNDIDLNNEEWTPIGSMYKDHGFMGNFDGNYKTIKNLKISNITPDSDGYAYAGLFGLTEGTDAKSNYVKNLTIENVNISTKGHIVSAAIAYPYYTTVENITVKGNIQISGGDYTAGVLAYTRRCVDAKNISIIGNSGSLINGKQTIGGVISDIQMNGGLKANYINFSAEGLKITGTSKVGGISGIICEQTLDGATVKNITIESGDVRKGKVSGCLGGKSTIKNITVENVTGADNIVGPTYDTASEVYVIGDFYTNDIKDTYTVGTIVEVEGVKGIIYQITDNAFKVVSVAETSLNGKYWQDAVDWASNLGSGWSLASMTDLDVIYDVRRSLNEKLSVDNAENALFEEDERMEDGNYALYISSTMAPYGETDANGDAYFANRVFLKYFNSVGYWDIPYSSFASINIYAPLKGFHFARGVYEISK